MRYFLSILCLFFLALICACKKDSDFIPPDTQDYSGRYYVKGTVESAAAPGGKLFSITTGRDSASGSTCELLTNYYNYQGYRTATSLLQENLRSRHFLPIFFGGMLSNSSFDNVWSKEQLDSIFQVGKKLPFGKGMGQVQIEFSDAVTLPVARPYSTEKANNSGNYVLIERVDDVVSEFDNLGVLPPLWAKVITFSFSCQLRTDGEPTYDEIALINCQASILLKPYVK